MNQTTNPTPENIFAHTNPHTFALFLSLRYTRAVINTSFIILTAILLFFGYKNPAGVFALIFYNGLFFALKNYYHTAKNYPSTSYDVPPSLSHIIPEKLDLSEQAANQLCLPAAVLIHIFLAIGFLYRMPLSIEDMRAFPLIMLSLVLITRYLSYFLLKIYLSNHQKNKSNSQ